MKAAGAEAGVGAEEPAAWAAGRRVEVARAMAAAVGTAGAVAAGGGWAVTAEAPLQVGTGGGEVGAATAVALAVPAASAAVEVVAKAMAEVMADVVMVAVLGSGADAPAAWAVGAVGAVGCSVGGAPRSRICRLVWASLCTSMGHARHHRPRWRGRPARRGPPWFLGSSLV